jgi:hypothetical protein
MPNIDLSILNQRQTPAFFASSLATRPAFGFAGRIFIDSDVPSTGLYRDTGSAWVQIADPGAGTTGTLQQVTTNGNTTTQGITITAGGLSSNIVTIASNGLSSTTNYIGQAMAISDNWKIYGTGSTSDQGEMVFQVGDNGSSYATGGERFRFSYDASSDGTAKDVFIVDYDISNFNTNLIVSSGNNLGVGVSVPSGLIHADGGASAARMIIDADNGIARIFSFRTDNLPRWALRVDGTETGSNVGGDFSIRRYDDTGAFVDAPLLITRSTGQSTFAKKVVIENNAGDQQLQIVSTTAPSIRLDNIQIGATKRAGLGISTATNNFIQGSTDRDFCIFNGSTTASPILFGVYDTTNVAEAARISAARNFLIGTTTDAGQKLQVVGTSYLSGNVGIGNTNPLTKLVVATASNVNLEVRNGIDFGLTGVAIDSRDDTRSTRNALFLAGAPVIISQGNLLIGTTTDAGEKLQVAGETAITNSAGVQLNLIFSGATRSTFRCDSAGGLLVNTANSYIINYINGAERLRIKTNTINISSLPTSSAGLSSGDLYSVAGVINIVP